MAQQYIWWQIVKKKKKKKKKLPTFMPIVVAK